MVDPCARSVAGIIPMMKHKFVSHPVSIWFFLLSPYCIHGAVRMYSADVSDLIQKVLSIGGVFTVAKNSETLKLIYNIYIYIYTYM